MGGAGAHPALKIAQNRKMSIQPIDIHEFKDGKMVRTWHTEGWVSGLHQSGVFDK